MILSVGLFLVFLSLTSSLEKEYKRQMRAAILEDMRRRGGFR